ncbi:hypothetical protein KFQ04_20100 [Pseudomonas synxantha]|nr:hypothetical protein KFQ04_20100 [Pseudomonas synxantha]
MTPENSTGPVPVKPELPAEVANGVTPAYLQANGDTLLVTVPVYPTQVVGSKIGMRIGGLTKNPSFLTLLPAQPPQQLSRSLAMCYVPFQTVFT